MMISLIKTIPNKSKYYLNTLLIKSMKFAGALVRFNNITKIHNEHNDF